MLTICFIFRLAKIRTDYLSSRILELYCCMNRLVFLRGESNRKPLKCKSELTCLISGKIVEEFIFNLR